MGNRCLCLAVTLTACVVFGVEAAEIRDRDVFCLGEWKQPSFQLTRISHIRFTRQCY
jgi:hypothetical protein